MISLVAAQFEADIRQFYHYDITSKKCIAISDIKLLHIIQHRYESRCWIICL